MGGMVETWARAETSLMVSERISPIARVIQELISSGMSTDTVGQLAELTGSQIRRLRNNEQPAASEDTVIMLAKVAGYSRERTLQLLLDNAMQRASQKSRQDLLHQAAADATTGVVGGSSAIRSFDPAALRLARRDSNDPVQHAALLQSISSPEHVHDAVWVVNPHCVYFYASRTDLGISAGSVLEVDLSDQALEPSGLYLVSDADHGAMPMTYVGTFAEHVHVFASSTHRNGVYRAIDVDPTDDPDILIVGRITRVVHQSLRTPAT